MKDFGFNYNSVKNQHGSRVAEATSDFYSLYTGEYAEWIASVYDRSAGGFYFSHSARDNDGYLPDIESTGQALGVIQDLGFDPDPYYLPEPMKSKIVGFVEGLQDPSDGFFYHPQWGKDINTSRRARDLASASFILNGFGHGLKYKSAIERMSGSGCKADENVIPDHLRSREAFVAYLDSLKVQENSYVAGQTIAMQAPQISAVGLAEVCIEYLNSLQRENGIWEEELNYASANGMLKICHAYNAMKADLPRLSEVAHATLTVAMNPESPKAIVDVFNPLMAVHYLGEIVKSSGNPERLTQLRDALSSCTSELLDTTRVKLSPFRQPDGSFSYYPRGYKYGDYQYSQAVIVAPGIDEGNMNACQLARATNIPITEALSLDVGAPYSPDDRKEFFALFND